MRGRPVATLPSVPPRRPLNPLVVVSTSEPFDESGGYFEPLWSGRFRPHFLGETKSISADSSPRSFARGPRSSGPESLQGRPRVPDGPAAEDALPRPRGVRVPVVDGRTARNLGPGSKGPLWFPKTRPKNKVMSHSTDLMYTITLFLGRGLEGRE